MQNITIVLADSQYLIRLGLRHFLESQKGFSILGEATNEVELDKLLHQSQPDVLILDYNQPDHFQQETVSRVKSNFPKTNILIISADTVKQNIYNVLENGVNSFLTKRCDEGEIIDAIRATAKGEKFFCSTVLDHLLEKSFGKEEEVLETTLTPRETEIVHYIANGLIAKEIAYELSLSPHTIYTHRKNIMKKLQFSSTSELVLYAVKHGLIDTPE